MNVTSASSTSQTVREDSGLARRGARNKGPSSRGSGVAERGKSPVFAFTRQDEQASNAVVTCTLLVYPLDVTTLTNLAFAYSYVFI